MVFPLEPAGRNDHQMGQRSLLPCRRQLKSLGLCHQQGAFSEGNQEIRNHPFLGLPFPHQCGLNTMSTGFIPFLVPGAVPRATMAVCIQRECRKPREDLWEAMARTPPKLWCLSRETGQSRRWRAPSGHTSSALRHAERERGLEAVISPGAAS